MAGPSFRSDAKHRISDDAALDQADPAQDQRAQFVRRNQQRLGVALGMAVDQRDVPGELADLGQEPNRRRRSISCGVSVGKVCSCRGNAKEVALAAGPAVVLSALISPPQKNSLRTAAPHHPASAREYPWNEYPWNTLGGYRAGSSPLASSRGASAASEGAATSSLRPRACDLRRLRFSRSASFNRSCRESFTSFIVRSWVSRFWPTYCVSSAICAIAG